MQQAELDPLFNNYLKEYPSISYVNPSHPWVIRNVVGSLELLLGRKKIEKIYHELKSNSLNTDDFFSNALKRAGIDVSYDQEKFNCIPKAGPLVIIANHPFGIIDGLIICDLIMRARKKFKIILHAMLCQDRDLAKYFIPIDFSESKIAIKNNIKSKKLALASLYQDIPVIIFPSGGVSTANKFGFGKVIEEPWKKFTAKLIMKSNSSVLPIYFYGQNSRKYHVAAHISESLRTGLLTNEALNKFNSQIKIEIGDVIKWNQIEHITKRSELTKILYKKVHSLKLN